MTDTNEYHKPEIVTLREYIEARLESLALAVEKQEAVYNERFKVVNEWRETYGDLVNRAVSRDAFDALAADFERRLADIKSDYDRRLAAIEQKQANLDGRIIGYSAGVGAVVLIIAIVMQLLNLGG